MRIPSTRTIAAAFPNLDKDEVEKVRGVLDGTLSPEKFTSVNDWLGRAYHRPERKELVLCALNELLEGHGVEYVGDEEDNLLAEYINMGDTYTATILFSRIHTTDWHVTTLGDFVETAERRGIKVK